MGITVLTNEQTQVLVIPLSDRRFECAVQLDGPLKGGTPAALAAALVVGDVCRSHGAVEDGTSTGSCQFSQQAEAGLKWHPAAGEGVHKKISAHVVEGLEDIGTANDCRESPGVGLCSSKRMG